MEEAAADNSVLDTDTTEVASRMALVSPNTAEQASMMDGKLCDLESNSGVWIQAVLSGSDPKP